MPGGFRTALSQKGRCPKLDSQWFDPCRVLERLWEVVYRVQLPPRGKKEALHRDRLAPYRGGSSPHEPLLPPHPSSSRPALSPVPLGDSSLPEIYFPVPSSSSPPPVAGVRNHCVSYRGVTDYTNSLEVPFLFLPFGIDYNLLVG